MHDLEIQKCFQRYRNLDISWLIDREKLDKIMPKDAPAPAASASSHLPFTATACADIDALAADTRNAHMELDAFISSDQLRQMTMLPNYSRGRRASPAVAASIRDASPTAASTSVGVAALPVNPADPGGAFPFSENLSQLDSFAADGADGGYFSQELQLSELPYADFSQRQAPISASVAPAKAALTSAAVPIPSTDADTSTNLPSAAPSALSAMPIQPQFTATHLFLTKHARSDRATEAAPVPVPVPLTKNQQFVAAFAGLNVPTSFVIGSNTTSTAAALAPQQPQQAQSPQVAAATAAPLAGTAIDIPSSMPPLSPGNRLPHPKSSLAVPAAASIPPTSPQASLSSSVSPSRPSHSSLPVTPSQPKGSASSPIPHPSSQQSHHNLLPDSLDNQLLQAATPGGSSVSRADEDEILRQESGFPFLTQAPLSILQEQEEEEEQLQDELSSPVRSNVRRGAGIPVLPRMPPHPPSAVPMEVDSEQASIAVELPSRALAAQPAAADISLAERQRERDRKLRAQLEIEEQKRRAEEEAVQRKRDVEAAAAAAELAKEQAKRAAEEEAKRLAREADAASRAEVQRTAQLTHASAAAVHPLTQAGDVSDDEVSILASALAPSLTPSKKRSRDETVSIPFLQPPSSAHIPATKRTRGGTGIPADLEQRVRAVIEAVENKQSQPTRINRQRECKRYPPLTLSTVGNSAKADVLQNKVTQPTASHPPLSIASLSSLPPFGAVRAISAAEVDAAVQYFRFLHPPSQRNGR